MREIKYLFVYGTLMNGMEANEILAHQGACFVGRGAMPGALYDLGDYPAVVKSDDRGGIVHGELYELTGPDVLRNLDEYEEYRPGRASNLFVREQVLVRRLDNERTVTAWTYLYNPRRSLRRAKRIESGDYRLAKAS
jgi:gamma-glutamylcyclotransferase (GGCT)/AIG2-like uncharacterized protein YtfP